jgi:hypothetical protein
LAVSTTPTPPPSTPTQIAGQQSAPSSSVPLGPAYTPAIGAKTNTLAVVSLVTGIGSFFAHVVPGIGGFTVSLIAIITGYMARQQIKQTGERGMGMATAGMIIGAIHLALIGLLVLVVLFLIFVLGVALFKNATR